MFGVENPRIHGRQDAESDAKRTELSCIVATPRPKERAVDDATSLFRFGALTNGAAHVNNLKTSTPEL